MLVAGLGLANAFVPAPTMPLSATPSARASASVLTALRMGAEQSHSPSCGALGRRRVLVAGLAALSYGALPREGRAERSYTSMTVSPL